MIHPRQAASSSSTSGSTTPDPAKLSAALSMLSLSTNGQDVSRQGMGQDSGRDTSGLVLPPYPKAVSSAACSAVMNPNVLRSLGTSNVTTGYIPPPPGLSGTVTPPLPRGPASFYALPPPATAPRPVPYGIRHVVAEDAFPGCSTSASNTAMTTSPAFTASSASGTPALGATISAKSTPSFGAYQPTHHRRNSSSMTTPMPPPMYSTLSQQNMANEAAMYPPPPPHIKHSLYKTELCRGWEETGRCRYGARCQFAHGLEELRNVNRHPKYKTEVCKTWMETGSCPYGRRCCFIHGEDDKNTNRATPSGPSVRTSPAAADIGNGFFGSEVPYGHIAELQRDDDVDDMERMLGRALLHEVMDLPETSPKKGTMSLASSPKKLNANAIAFGPNDASFGERYPSDASHPFGDVIPGRVFFGNREVAPRVRVTSEYAGAMASSIPSQVLHHRRRRSGTLPSLAPVSPMMPKQDPYPNPRTSRQRSISDARHWMTPGYNAIHESNGSSGHGSPTGSDVSKSGLTGSRLPVFHSFS